MKVELLGHYGTDLTVVNAARVSMDKESEWKYPWSTDYRGTLLESDSKLIKYLHTHKHHSPFNHAFLSFRVKAPIFVARQLVKHKFMPWNEVSRRYVDSEPEFYDPEVWRKRADNVKQGSSNETVDLNQELVCERYTVKELGDQLYKEILNHYQTLLERGVCPEQARMVLPQSMYTEWIWSGTLGAFLDMLVLRLDPHTQKETRMIAEMIALDIKRLFPVSYNVVVEDNKGN
jgi:thymidylate synthase (FAD)